MIALIRGRLRRKHDDRVVIEALDLAGNRYRKEATGLKARAIQHEIDHLNGVLFVDYLSKLKRDRVLKKFTKAAKRAGVHVEFVKSAKDALDKATAAHGQAGHERGQLGREIHDVHQMIARGAGRGFALASPRRGRGAPGWKTPHGPVP